MTLIHCSCGKTYDDKYLFKHLNSIHHQKFVEYRWNKDDAMKKYKKRKTEILYMNRSYSDYLDIIDQIIWI